MGDLIRDVLDSLTLYFVYFYPGIITIFLYRFIRGRSIVENQMTFIKGITISYIYVAIMSLFRQKAANDFTVCEHILLILIAFMIPIIWNLTIKSIIFKKVLCWLKVDTELSDNLLDLIKSKETNPKNGIVLKIFLDNQGLMYEGKLRDHESDESKQQIICLSGYRRYIKIDNSYSAKNDYSGDNSRWVAIKDKDITRIEIKYEDEK